MRLQKRSRARIISAALVALAVCALAGGSSDSAASHSAAAGWHRLPPLPGGQRSPDDAAVATVGDTLYAVVVSHPGSDQPVANVWRWTGAGWDGPEGGPVAVDLDSPVQLIGGPRLCLAAINGREPFARCLGATGWEPLGGRIWKPDRYAVVGSFFMAGGNPYVLRSTVLNPHVEGVGVAGRPVEDLFTLDGDRWRRIHRARLNDAQRGAGYASARGRPCEAANLSGRPRPAIQVRCLDGGWKRAAPLLRAPKGKPIDVDGVARSGGRLYLGADRFSDRGVDWTVGALVGGKWRRTGLGASSRRWDEQGTLLAAGHQVIALRFDQRHSGRGFRARFVVRALDRRSGTTRDLGPPLVRDSPLLSTVSFGLAATPDTLYALYSRPIRATGQEELAVSARPR